jgi:hypothetical protein
MADDALHPGMSNHGCHGRDSHTLGAMDDGLVDLRRLSARQRQQAVTGENQREAESSDWM